MKVRHLFAYQETLDKNKNEGETFFWHQKSLTKKIKVNHFFAYIYQNSGQEEK